MTARERAHALTEALGLLASREDTALVEAAILAAQSDVQERCAKAVEASAYRNASEVIRALPPEDVKP